MANAGGEVVEKQLEGYFDRLWPICRSITGDGLRESFSILQEIIPLELTEVPTGTRVFDWEIPMEWNIWDAYILTPDGRKICDFKKNNLQVVNYSVPVDREIGFGDLKEHLHFLKEQPDVVPYITSYYKDNWGFCISFNEYMSLPEEGIYRVFIGSEKKNGGLTYGSLLLKGETDREVLFSSYLCHPSMANNELSGPLALAFLYKEVAAIPRRKYSYRFVIAPETIGIIAFLARFGHDLKEKLHAGIVLTCCGDPGKIHYKRSKRGNAEIDRIAEHVLKYSERDYGIRDFMVGGSDERQFCSPGFNLPVGSVMRTPYKEYREYHTSADDKKFISFSALKDTVEYCLQLCKALEMNNIYKCTVQYGEPQLGKRGLYPAKGAWTTDSGELMKLLFFLTYCDGAHSLLDISEKYNKPMLSFQDAVTACFEKGLIETV